MELARHYTLHLENWARSKNAFCIQTELKDHLPYALSFVKELGFTVRKRSRYSSLNMEHVRDEPFRHIFSTLKEQGIQIHTLRDEREKADFDRGKLYELYKTTYIEIPGEEAREYTFEEWKKKVDQTNPGQIIVACYQDRYVGISHLQFRQRGNYLWHEYTGVDRSFRRRNIALALLSIEKARQLGVERLITSNSILNEPMINLNNKLGYTRIPGHYVIEKSLDLR
jgi:GNAT superfamily N-acetyltransferase